MQAYAKVQRHKVKRKIETCIVEWAIQKYDEYEEAKKTESELFDAFIRRRKEDRMKF